MNQKGFAEFIVILIIALVALSLIGFNLYKNGQLKTSLYPETEKPQNENEDTVENINKETQLYKNLKVNYSIEIPSDWTIKEIEGQQLMYSDVVMKSSDTSFDEN